MIVRVETLNEYATKARLYDSLVRKILDEIRVADSILKNISPEATDIILVQETKKAVLESLLVEVIWGSEV